MFTGTSESAARRAAQRAGLRAWKSRRQRNTPNNQGGFMLTDPSYNIAVAGFQFDLTPEEVIEFCSD